MKTQKKQQRNVMQTTGIKRYVTANGFMLTRKVQEFTQQDSDLR